MDDLHDRVGESGKESGEDFDAAELARSIWDTVAPPVSKVAEQLGDLASLVLSATSKKPEDGRSERAPGPESEALLDRRANRWQPDGRISELSDRISNRATINVDEKDFLAINPVAEGKIQGLIGKNGFKARHATTNETDGGWKIEALNKDGSLRLSKDYKFTVQARENHDGLVEAIPGVSSEHIKALEDKLTELPANVLKALKDNGYKIVATRFNTDAIPELKGLSPRGWDKTSTFDTSDGTHDNVRRVILAPYGYIHDNSVQKVDRPEVLVHQIGHALDHANGKLSNDPEFQEAFKKDMRELAKKGLAMSERERLIYDYFNQKRGPIRGEQPGSEECFASLFGLVLTGPENPQDKKPFEDNFKNSIEVVRKQIKRL